MCELGTFTFSGPAGRIEAKYQEGSERPLRAAVICHPHPLHGGTLHNKVVYGAARALNSRGYPTLRFNFRGAGHSEGVHDEGRGEADDVRAAIAWMATEHAGVPIVLAGFSFGSVVGIPVGATDDRVSDLIAIGAPTGRFRFDLLADVDKPKLFVHGDRDEFGPLDAMQRDFAGVAEPKTLAVIDDADHFFTGRQAAFREAVVQWAAATHGLVD